MVQSVTGLDEPMEMDTEETTNGVHTEETEVSVERKKIKYPVDTAPFPLLWPVYALQYILLTIPGILATAVILADQLGAGDLPGVRSELFSIGLFTSGVAAILQMLAGCRLPTSQGMNTVYIVSIASILQSSKFNNENQQIIRQINITENSTVLWNTKVSEGNLLLASGTQFLLGATGVIGFLLRFIGPVTLAPVFMLIGISISEYMIPLCAQHWGIATLSIALVLVFSLMLVKVSVPVPVLTRKFSVVRYPLFQLNAIFLALALSWLFSYILTITDVLPSNSTMYGHMARTDIRNNVLYTTSWLYFPRPFSYGTPTFSAGGYVGMVTVSLITIMELIGGYYALARVTDTAPPPLHAVNRGIAVDGLSCAFCSVFGNVCGNVPYLQIIGCISVTQVASRAVFLTAACMLIMGGVVGKIGAALTLIPDPVIGGVSLVSMAMLASVGMSLLRHVDLSSTRNMMIIGLSFLLGLKVPAWTSQNEDVITTGYEEVNQLLKVLLTNPMCVTGVIGCILDNITPGNLEERGIVKWRQNTADTSETYTTSDDIYNLPFITKILTRIKCCVYCPISPSFASDTKNCSCRTGDC